MEQFKLSLDPLPTKTRREVFLDEMNQVVPWSALVALFQPHVRGAHQALGGRPLFPIEAMMRIRCLHATAMANRRSMAPRWKRRLNRYWNSAR